MDEQSAFNESTITAAAEGEASADKSRSLHREES